MISLLCGIKNNQNQARRYGEQTDGCQRQGVGVDEMDKGSQIVQTVSYNIIKSWSCNIHHGDYS